MFSSSCFLRSDFLLVLFCSFHFNDRSLEWWTFELVILLAGLLPDPKLQTSVLSVCLTTTSLHFYVQYGIGAAGSTRISNELGAGNHQAARVAVQVVLISFNYGGSYLLAQSCSFAVTFLDMLLVMTRGVVDYVAELAPLLCFSLVLDGLQAIFSGIARGCGWQHVGAYVNLGAYYLVATPLAVLLCFVLHLGSKGLWTGLLIGSVAQVTSFAVITSLTNWQKQAATARERIFEGSTFSWQWTGLNFGNNQWIDQKLYFYFILTTCIF
ncbi:hypothetical protein OIU78_000691 [Salix suchowensis]|nr:hypothetical protein OIU78_000691 [Salix suchowensis]